MFMEHVITILIKLSNCIEGWFVVQFPKNTNRKDYNLSKVFLAVLPGEFVNKAGVLLNSI